MTSAKRYIGTRELTGQNDGKEVEAFLASVNLQKGQAWCAAFVNFIYEMCQVKTPKSGWVPTWFPANKLVYKAGKVIKRIPIKGDVFGIYFASKKRLAHIGFIESWGEGKYATCIEGNTNSQGSREGDGVYRKYRLKSQLHSVASYIHD
ncbi:CHAP domain-containing protein [Rhodocytophaga aerolata]|uniref:CHAP domain-containing protein n=1 Tax=Rhodocytophaga aerolata TaxID=455078 RepID=A0ABT8RDY6_9BACT|nr:CHAP domain-containing protein [Rhodocytophaga aerolata]MDO1449559.1 CHAP domain-containing protein [Rhodocytophaga aerolata]